MSLDANRWKVVVAALMAIAAGIFVNIYAAIPFALYEIWKAHQLSRESTETTGEVEG